MKIEFKTGLDDWEKSERVLKEFEEMINLIRQYPVKSSELPPELPWKVGFSQTSQQFYSLI
jgi:hypothetical protein